MTFDLSKSVLASMSPVLERDPATLRDWADNLDKVALAYLDRGNFLLSDRMLVRAAYLRRLADQAGMTS